MRLSQIKLADPAPRLYCAILTKDRNNPESLDITVYYYALTDKLLIMGTNSDNIIYNIDDDTLHILDFEERTNINHNTRRFNLEQKLILGLINEEEIAKEFEKIPYTDKRLYYNMRKIGLYDLPPRERNRELISMLINYSNIIIDRKNEFGADEHGKSGVVDDFDLWNTGEGE